MEKYGITVEKDALKEYGDQLIGRIEELEQNIYEKAGKTFNINSPKQLGVILFEDLKIPLQFPLTPITPSPARPLFLIEEKIFSTSPKSEVVTTSSVSSSFSSSSKYLNRLFSSSSLNNWYASFVKSVPIFASLKS